MALPIGRRRSIEADLQRPLGVGYVHGEPDLVSSSTVYALFERVPDGLVLVTIYPKVT